MGEMLIWPGIENLYRVVIAYPNGDYETVSEHDTPEQAVDAKDNARSAAADALIALSECMVGEITKGEAA